MKNYDVSLPITGVILVTVEAESAEDAIERALQSDGLTDENIESWEAHSQVCEGNIMYGELDRAYAELAFGEDEEE